jgi:hypothetical protein
LKGILGIYAERGRNYELGFLGFSGFIGYANPEKPKKPINSIYAVLPIALRQLRYITRSIYDNWINLYKQTSIVFTLTPRTLACFTASRFKKSVDEIKSP